jgi:hypothetical protein
MSLSRNRWHRFVTAKLRKDGLAVDVRIVAADLQENDAFAREMDLIAYWLSLGAKLVNVTPGGDGRRSPSEEARKKQSETMKAKYAAMTPEERREKLGRNVGVPVSKETREKLRIASTGRTHTPETIENMKVAAKKRGVSPVTREAHRIATTGKKRAPFSESTIAKMQIASTERERKKREHRVAEGKPYLFSKCRQLVCLDDGLTFPSVTVAAKHYGTQRSTVQQVCTGGRGRKTAGGRRFSYLIVEAA